MENSLKQFLGPVLAVSILVSGGVGYFAGQYGAWQRQGSVSTPPPGTAVDIPAGEKQGDSQAQPREVLRVITQEQQVIEVVRRASPAVVSVIVTKDLPIIERFEADPFRDFLGGDPFFEQFFGPRFRIPEFRQKGTQKREVGGGTGFVITQEGLIVTNRHVVQDTSAEYTVLTNEGEKMPALVLARHPTLDLAVLKIERQNLPTLVLGGSEDLKEGQTVIAIGNALGEFRNTVSVGVISGLRRTITAGDGRSSEELENVIQTDAAINRGNSGGPLLNIKGEVIGINVAVAIGAENIGFAIPVDQAKKMIEEVRTTGKLRIPFLGVRYVIINDAIQRANNLPVNYGAVILSGQEGEAAVTPGSPAQTAGLRENDIVLEFDGEKIDEKNTLSELITQKQPGQEVALKVLRGTQTLLLKAVLGER